MAAKRMSIDLWHNQWNLGIHAESTGLVDHSRPSCGSDRSILLRLGSTGRKERHLDALEGAWAELLHGHGLAAESN